MKSFGTGNEFAAAAVAAYPYLPMKWLPRNCSQMGSSSSAKADSQEWLIDSSYTRVVSRGMGA
eukprot:6455221-Amphidinium_carterae.1